jgi:glycosyltransferase involved in cell wall biosynthesis
VFLDLAREFAERGYRVDMVLARLRGELVSDIPESVRTFELGISPLVKALRTLFRLPIETWKAPLPAIISKRPTKVRSLPGLERYLLEERPDVLMATTDIPNLIALWAAWLAKVKTRLIIRQANTLTNYVNMAPSKFHRKLPSMIRQWYHMADGIISVSRGVADDLSRVAAISQERISIIYNPINLERIAKSATQEFDNPWFQPGQPPVLVAVGSLHPQKDYPTLLRAFVRVRTERNIRLVILGEGSERKSLEALIEELGVVDDVQLLGFQKNPYTYMSRAAVFVLSSIYEGFPNVLLEALACGCPIISTDCPNGPAELLDRGRFGLLVPVGDDAAFAEAILRALEAPNNAIKLKRRAEEFSIDTIADRYLDIFLGTESRGKRKIR